MEYSIVESINRHIQKNIKGLRITGSFKRKDDIINDLEYITKKPIDDILLSFQELYELEIIICGLRFISFWFNSDFEPLKICIYRACDNYEYWFKCLAHDVSLEQYLQMKEQALKANYMLDDNGLKNAIGQMVFINNRKKLRKLIKTSYL